MSFRMAKIDELIRREMGLILGQIKDKYLGFITVTKVETARDLDICKIWISSLEEHSENELNRVLRHYMRDIYDHFKARVPLKKTPHLIFKLDKSAIHVSKIESLLEKIKISENNSEHS